MNILESIIIGALAHEEPSYFVDVASQQNIIEQKEANADTSVEAQHFPEFSFTDINPNSATYNQPITLDSLTSKGKPIIINFWHYSCSPCLKEMPDFQKLYERNEAMVVGFGLSGHEVFNKELRKSPDTAYAAAEYAVASVTFPLLGSAAEENALGTFFQSSLLYYGDSPTLPLTFILRPDGMVDKHYLGGRVIGMYKILKRKIESIETKE